MSILALKQVALTRSATTILNGIDWKVEPGQNWAIIGANGSGKTMLLKVITGYQWPTRGEVEVLGLKFGETDLRELRKEIGWVSFDLQKQVQESTVYEVVLSGYMASIGLYEMPPEKYQTWAKALIKMVGLEGKEDQAFQLLSYGEQKRTLIARSLLHEPKLLILDEPCSGLDLRAREQFLQFIEELAQKPDSPTVIFVTHHIEEILPSITHVLCLKDGQVFKQGTKEEIITEATISEVLGVKLELHKKGNRFSVSF